MGVVVTLRRRRKKPVTGRLSVLRCPGCGHVIGAIVRAAARYDYLCPRCHGRRLSEFTKDFI